MSTADTTIATELVDRLAVADRIVFFTGAGVSAESGVATFRATDGLWSKFRPEELANVEAFLANPQMVWEWYQARRSVMLEAKPNDGHRAMVDFETTHEQVTIITQNIDGLHAEAGSRDVIELHGNLRKNFCRDCERRYDDVALLSTEEVQRCDDCNGLIRPDVVWFGEMLPQEAVARAEVESRSADVFLSIGTSSVVWPAAGLPLLAVERGAFVVEINPDETPLSRHATTSIRGTSGQVLPELFARVREKMATG